MRRKWKLSASAQASEREMEIENAAYAEVSKLSTGMAIVASMKALAVAMNNWAKERQRMFGADDPRPVYDYSPREQDVAYRIIERLHSHPAWSNCDDGILRALYAQLPPDAAVHVARVVARPFVLRGLGLHL